jgi:hypothetical protein
MAHMNLVALWPDVDAPGFDTATLPEDTTVEEMRRVREQYRQRFDVSAPNPERLDRRNLASLLPQADHPKLQRNPFLTVVGHDPETFAYENEVSVPVCYYNHSLRDTDGPKEKLWREKSIGHEIRRSSLV